MGRFRATGKLQSPSHKETVLAEVARLDRRGWTQWDIADELKKQGMVDVSQVMVGKYLKEIRERCAQMMLEERKALIAEKVEQYREVRREAWDAWERSKQDTKRKTRELGLRKDPVRLKRGEDKKPPNHNPDKGDLQRSLVLLKQIIVTEGRLPESEYLKIVKETIDAEVKLMGLTVEVNVNNTQNNVTLGGGPAVDLEAFWNGFFARTEGREPIKVEAKVLEGKR